MSVEIEDRKWLKLLQDYDKHCIRIQQATTVDIHETANQKLLRVRQKEQSYSEWFEYYFPNYAKVKCAWFHLELADLLIKNKCIRLLAELFRSAGKSVHVCMGIPLYLYLVKKDLFFYVVNREKRHKSKETPFRLTGSTTI